MNLRAKLVHGAMLAMAPLRRFGADKRGVSAVEFTLLMPFMITLYFGGVQLSQAIDIDRKVTLAARTLADLTSQVASTTSSSMDGVLNAATAVLSPYADSAGNSSKLMTRASVIKIDANLKATIEWSKAKNGAAFAKGQTVTVPGELGKIPNSYLVLGEATYAYTPPIGHVITGTMNLDDKIYMRPRLSESVVCTSC